MPRCSITPAWCLCTSTRRSISTRPAAPYRGVDPGRKERLAIDLFPGMTITLPVAAGKAGIDGPDRGGSVHGIGIDLFSVRDAPRNRARSATAARGYAGGEEN